MPTEHLSLRHKPVSLVSCMMPTAVSIAVSHCPLWHAIRSYAAAMPMCADGLCLQVPTNGRLRVVHCFDTTWPCLRLRFC